MARNGMAGGSAPVRRETGRERQGPLGPLEAWSASLLAQQSLSPEPPPSFGAGTYTTVQYAQLPYRAVLSMPMDYSHRPPTHEPAFPPSIDRPSLARGQYIIRAVGTPRAGNVPAHAHAACVYYIVKRDLQHESPPPTHSRSSAPRSRRTPQGGSGVGNLHACAVTRETHP